MRYAEKLKDPKWQKKRLEILKRDDWQCQNCGDKEETLHVHHKDYLPGKDPWDIPSEFLITLCAPCHETEGDMLDSSIDFLVQAAKRRLFSEEIYTLAAGLAGGGEHFYWKDIFTIQRFLLDSNFREMVKTLEKEHLKSEKNKSK